MGQLFAASIYGVNANNAGTAQGQTMAFPSSGVLVRPVSTDSNFNGTFNGVTVNSVIQLLPGGTVVNQPQYYTSLTVAQVVTAANA